MLNRDERRVVMNEEWNCDWEFKNLRLNVLRCFICEVVFCWRVKMDCFMCLRCCSYVWNEFNEDV